jgi:hypothetical protein
MAITTTTKYTTSDKRVFNDVASAEAHELYLANAEVVEAYMHGAGVTAPQAQGALRKHLPGFWAFAESYVPGTRPLPKAEEAAPAEAAPADHEVATA